MTADTRDTQLCRNLANAVMHQAYQDLTHNGPINAADKVAAVRDARALFTDQSGPWAESRKMWCEAAGLREEECLKIAERHAALFKRQDEKIAEHLKRVQTNMSNRSAPGPNQRVAIIAATITKAQQRRAIIWNQFQNGKSIEDIAQENKITYLRAKLLVREGEILELRGGQ